MRTVRSVDCTSKKSRTTSSVIGRPVPADTPATRRVGLRRARARFRRWQLGLIRGQDDGLIVGLIVRHQIAPTGDGGGPARRDIEYQLWLSSGSAAASQTCSRVFVHSIFLTPRTTGERTDPSCDSSYGSGRFCLVATRFTITLLGPSVRRHIGHRTPITPERETRAVESPSFRCELNLRYGQYPR